MNKRKILIIGIICTIILTIVGSTAAFFGWRADDALVSLTVSSGQGSCEKISDNEVLLEPTTARERGRIIKLSAKQQMSSKAYISWELVINNISDLQHESFKYELINSTTGVSYGSGNFSDINAEPGSNKIIFENLEEKLTYDEEYEFILYLWIDGVNFNNPHTMGGKDFDFDISCNIYDLSVTLNNVNADNEGTTTVYFKDNNIYLDQQLTQIMTTTENPITVPTKKGYTFDGYYAKIEDIETNIINTEGYITEDLSSILESKSLNIYAKWTLNTYTITYNINGGDIASNDIKTYTTPGEYTYTVPSDNIYRLEVWGAEGETSGGSGGYGGYSTGVISFLKNELIYVNVGGAGDAMKGGYNGGGAGSNLYTTGDAYKNGGGGGGATHIATVSGELSSLETYKGELYEDGLTYNSSDILIVAGGGGGGAYISGNYNGGSGGGISGVTGTGYSITVNAGTQITGNAFGIGQSGLAGSNASWSESGRGGGGGGFYGGNASQTSTNGIAGGGGGSGYIGSSLLSDKYMYCYNCTTSSETDTLTYSTTNVSSSPIANYAKSGDGAVRIIQISDYTFSATYGTTYGTLLTAIRDGYTFAGWNTKADGSGEMITSNSTINIAENHTLYAIWNANYTITYDANGGSGAPSSQMKSYGETLTLSDTIPTRDGYIFLGWSTNSSATSATYSAGSTFTENSDTTLYAVWEAEKPKFYLGSRVVTIVGSGYYPTSYNAIVNTNRSYTFKDNNVCWIVGFYNGSNANVSSSAPYTVDYANSISVLVSTAGPNGAGTWWVRLDGLQLY